MAKSFVLQLASLVTLFVSLPALITLLFGIINLKFPDAADTYWQATSSEDSARYAIAVLAIFFPAYLIITRIVNKARRNEGELYHTLTKWLVYLALLVGGMTMLVDLAVVVYTFLGGEITIRFILKSVSLLVVIAAAFAYYAYDAKGYWQKREKASISIALGALALVIAAAAYGVSVINSPTEARAIKLDQQQVSDLQDIQWRVEDFYRMNDSFPANLETLYGGLTSPTAPEGRTAYEYRVTGSDTYVLCATFAKETPVGERNMITGPDMKYQNWDHTEGEYCFERKITPVE